MTMTDRVTRLADRRKTAGACPICGKPPADRFRPFCSARCADVDLTRWLGGVYAGPGEPGGAEEDESSGGA